MDGKVQNSANKNVGMQCKKIKECVYLVYADKSIKKTRLYTVIRLCL